jgi:DNA-binding transcriptional ArsR family regulator
MSFELHDPRVMRALAHPRRVELLRRLRTHGPATATVLGEATAQSPASASYHLRQLAAHGLAEEVAGRGQGRERWWRATQPGTRIGAEAFLDPQTRSAATAVAAAALADATAVAARFLDATERGEVPAEWLDAALLDDTPIHATPEELRELGQAMAALCTPLLRREAALRPPASRPCHVSIRTIPLPDR